MSLRPRAVILTIVAVMLAACSTGEARPLHQRTGAPATCVQPRRDRCGVHARGQRRRAHTDPAPDSTARQKACSHWRTATRTLTRPYGAAPR